MKGTQNNKPVPCVSKFEPTKKHNRKTKTCNFEVFWIYSKELWRY